MMPPEFEQSESDTGSADLGYSVTLGSMVGDVGGDAPYDPPLLGVYEAPVVIDTFDVPIVSFFDRTDPAF